MIDSQLRPSGVNDGQLIAAIDAVGREAFLPEARRAVAYRDRSLDLSEGRFAMAPTPLFKLVDRLAPQAGEKILVAGPLAAYAGAVLARLGVDVVALDSAAATGPDMERMAIATGPLDKGVADEAPFDAILIVGAIEQLSEELTGQLAEKGRVAAAILSDGVTRLAIGRRSGEGVAFRTFADAQVAPLGEFAKVRGFQF
nr:protein-L-isoaspartate O-methyltransferase [Sphingomicrobium sediminis]